MLLSHITGPCGAYGACVPARPWTLPLVAAALLSLSACQKNASGKEDLTTKILFTATGAYDAQADRIEKISSGVRRATWSSKPPLPAQQITAQYDGNARALAWELEISAPKFKVQDIAGQDARAVKTTQGQGWLPSRTSRLNDVLILTTPSGLKLLTRAYATQRESELLPAFKGQ